MALIDPKGLLYGERLGDCSDEAQLHWPRLFATANGYGRTELSYERLCDTVYQSFKKKPTFAQLSALFQDFHKNYLLFVYQAADGSMWGQWMTSEKWLPKFKTQADRNSPAPDPEAVKAYMDEYIEKRKAKYLSFQSFHKSSKISENVPKTSEDFSLGVGVGEGVGGDKKPIPSGIVAADAAPPQIRPEDFANTWNRERGTSLAKVAEFTEDRRRKTKIRMNAGMTLEKFRSAVARCRDTPFLNGDNDRGWRADYDWLMKNGTNIAKVLEGKYDGVSKEKHSEGFYERLQRELEADEAELDEVGCGPPGAG